MQEAASFGKPLAQAGVSNGSNDTTTEIICEVREMISTRRIETVVVKQCHSCSAELIAYDNFCRRCGVIQKADQFTPDNNPHWMDCETKALQKCDAEYQMMSGPLVKTLTRSLAAETASLLANPFGAHLIAAVVAIPMWVLIILLSPIGAYTAAKVALRRTDY